MIRVMATGMDDTTKNQLFWDKHQAEQPITITNLRVASTGMVFMHKSRVIKDIPTMSVPFKYVPPAALPVTSIADVVRSKKTRWYNNSIWNCKMEWGLKNTKQLKPLERWKVDGLFQRNWHFNMGRPNIADQRRRILSNNQLQGKAFLWQKTEHFTWNSNTTCWTTRHNWCYL